MPIITSTDLNTHLYPEVVAEITRNDSTIVTKAIDTAIQESKMYLSRYDLLALFGTDEEPATITDEYLKSIVKDIACWHLLRLCNVSIELSTFRTAYEDAIATLKVIMQGGANPQGWPYYDATTISTPDGDAIQWFSNTKRVNYF